MGMMLAQEGRAEAKRQNSKELPIQYQQCQIYRKFLGVLSSPPYLGLIFLDHAILSLLSTSPHCPTQPFYKAHTNLVYCLGLIEWNRISPRKIFRTLLQFLCIVFHCMNLSETLDLWHEFYPSANA